MVAHRHWDFVKVIISTQVRLILFAFNTQIQKNMILRKKDFRVKRTFLGFQNLI